MICIHCRLELFPEPEPLGDDVKRWVDKTWGEWTCPTPTGVLGVVEHGHKSHSPAYEISRALLDDIVEDLACAAEMADGIGETAVAEMLAQLAEIVSTEPKLVKS